MAQYIILIKLVLTLNDRDGKLVARSPFLSSLDYYYINFNLF